MSDYPTPRTDEYVKTRASLAYCVERDTADFARQLERDLTAAHNALMLAAEWGVASDGYSAEVAGELRCWIIGGMKGPPPKAPDFYPKRNRHEDRH